MVEQFHEKWIQTIEEWTEARNAIERHDGDASFQRGGLHAFRQAAMLVTEFLNRTAKELDQIADECQSDNCPVSSYLRSMADGFRADDEVGEP